MKNENIEKESASVYSESFDGPVAAPEHHKVIFEDERVRIMEFKCPPGDVVPLHTHRWASVNYVLRLSDFLSFDADGNLKLDSREGKFGGKEGEAFCLPPFPPLHSVENIGDREMHGISVELKN